MEGTEAVPGKGPAKKHFGWLKKKRKDKAGLKLIAIVLSAVLIIAAVSLYAIAVYSSINSKKVNKPVAYFGPRIVIESNEDGAAIGNNTAINVQIYSAVPDSFVKNGISIHSIPSGNQWNNSVNDELLNATMMPGNNSTGTLFMPPLFNSIAEEWVPLLSRDTGTNYPSLTVEAVKSVELNGSIQLYQYYNNLPFDPFNLSIVSANSTVLSNSTLLSSTGRERWFNGTGLNPSDYSEVYFTNLSFNLRLVFPSTPLQVIPMGSQASEAASSADSGTSAHYTIPPPHCPQHILLHLSKFNM
jgi:hypothetical protein